MSTRVLVADDESDIQDVMQLYLESKGYEVETAYDGADALIKAREFNPDVLLLDIMMPLKDGIQVCREIKASDETKNIVVIMVSAASKPEKEGEAYRAGAQGYIMKPFEPSELIAVIEKSMKGAMPS